MPSKTNKRRGYAFGGGVLGTLGRAAGQRFKAPTAPGKRDMRIPELPAMLGNADKASNRFRGWMGKMRARGGKV